MIVFQMSLCPKFVTVSLKPCSQKMEMAGRALPRCHLKSEPGGRELSLLAAFAEGRGSSSEKVAFQGWFWFVGFFFLGLQQQPLGKMAFCNKNCFRVISVNLSQGPGHPTSDRLVPPPLPTLVRCGGHQHQHQQSPAGRRRRQQVAALTPHTLALICHQSGSIMSCFPRKALSVH